MLKPETERVWNFIRGQQTLTGFILLGGSAIALHLHHRISEDLDLVWPELKLPRARLDALGRSASEAGVDLQSKDDPAALHEFAEGGLELRDYQQDFIANNAVKVSFFTPSESLLRVLEAEVSPSGVRVATLNELFKTKCLVSALRSKTRDWFDLYVLMNQCGYSMHDYHEAFQLAGIPDQAAIGLQRLCGTAPAGDEGYEQLVANAPAPDTLQQFFRAQRDAYERSAAAQAWRKSREKQ